MVTSLSTTSNEELTTFHYQSIRSLPISAVLRVLTKHPDELYKFSPKESENLLLTPIIEQNTMMREEMECMKKEVNAVF